MLGSTGLLIFGYYPWDMARASVDVILSIPTPHPLTHHSSHAQAYSPLFRCNGLPCHHQTVCASDGTNISHSQCNIMSQVVQCRKAVSPSLLGIMKKPVVPPNIFFCSSIYLSPRDDWWGLVNGYSDAGHIGSGSLSIYTIRVKAKAITELMESVHALGLGINPTLFNEAVYHRQCWWAQ